MFKAGSHRLPVLSFLRLCQNEHKAGKHGKNCGTEKCLIDIIKPSQGKNVFTFTDGAWCHEPAILRSITTPVTCYSLGTTDG